MSSVVSGRVSVQDLAKQYEAEGYEVIVEPAKDEIPDFLRRYHPDLVATRPDRSVVVEAISPHHVRSLDYWRELMDAVRSHPDWHLEILANGNSTAAQQNESLSQPEIENLLRQSEDVATQGEQRAALLLAWSAAEAAMRLVAERYNVKVMDQKSVHSLLSRLISEGLMDREDYNFLLACMETRSAIAHGYRSIVTLEELTRLNEVAHTLLTE